MHVQARAEAEHLKRSSEGQEVPGLEMAALQAKFGALAAKHEEALGKLTQMAAAKEAAEAAKEAAASEAHTHQQHARTHAIRCGCSKISNAFVVAALLGEGVMGIVRLISACSAIICDVLIDSFGSSLSTSAEAP